MTLPRQLKHPKEMNVQKEKKTNALCNELCRKACLDFLVRMLGPTAPQDPLLSAVCTVT